MLHPYNIVFIITALVAIYFLPNFIRWMKSEPKSMWSMIVISYAGLIFLTAILTIRILAAIYPDSFIMIVEPF